MTELQTSATPEDHLFKISNIIVAYEICMVLAEITASMLQF